MAMTLRERFNKTMHYEKPDKLPFFEFGYWNETLPTWHEQGLPKEVDDETKAYDYFGIEEFAWADVNVEIKGPFREEKVITEDEETVTYRNYVGVVCQQNKTRPNTIPHHLEFPLKEPKDWEWFRERLQPGGRLPENWPEVAKELNQGELPVKLGIAGLLGRIRDWMGFEEFAIASLTKREWVAEMMEDITVMVVDTVREAISGGLKPDLGTGWEDICYNSGPICDLKFFDEEAVPRFKRITDELRKGGCDLCWSDCDGNINLLVPGFLKSGVNCMFPLEVNAGSDPVLLREKFGKDLRLFGGVDKMIMARGKEAMEKEFKRLLPVVEEGGFIPHCDHRCPPTVSLENYKFYLDLKRSMFNCGGEGKY